MAITPNEGLKQLAATTGLSVSTISRVLNGKAEAARISAATRQLVLTEAAKHGIVINAIARGLRLRRTQTLGLLIPDISNPFFAALARQVEHASRARGYSVLLGDSEENIAVEAQNAALMQSRRVDGLIIAPVGGEHQHLISLHQSGLPLVLVDRILPELPVPGVAADNAKGAAMAVDHLVAKGHRRIGCVQGLHASSTNQARVKGFQKALERHRLSTSKTLIAGTDYKLDSARGAALTLQQLRPRPTAIVALGNIIALGVLHAARDLGLRVPEDLSLVSFDDQPWAEWISPPLTTIAQPVEDLGAKAMDLFFQQLDAPSTQGEAKQIRLPMTLIERQSVTHPPDQSPP